MLRYSVKVSSGPGTAGYEKLTPTQRNKQTPWAAFTLSSSAEGYAADVRKMHPTWIVTVHDLENERYQRQQAAAREEEAARASVADQQRHEWKTAQRNREYLDRPEFAHAPNQPQRASLLSPEEDAMIAELAGQPQRRSSVDYLYSYNPETHPEAVDEVGRLILRNAADYMFNNTPYDQGDELAVDRMDALRDMDWGDLNQKSQGDAARTLLAHYHANNDSRQHTDEQLATEYANLTPAQRDTVNRIALLSDPLTPDMAALRAIVEKNLQPAAGAADPRNDRPSTDADDENDDSKPEPQDEDADGHITEGEKATGTE